jgi:HTH-type transcriptional regulator/antitoxin HipB
MEVRKLAKIIRAYRKESGLSQQALAQLAGVGKTVVFDLENNKQTVQLNTVLKVLDVLNIQIQLIPPFPLVENKQ